VTGSELNKIVGGRGISAGFCRRDRYELLLEMEASGRLRVGAGAEGVRARIESEAPDPGAWAPLGEAQSMSWYRADLGLTTLSVAIAQGLTVARVRVETPQPDDLKLKLDFAGARTFVLYADADVDGKGRLQPRLRSRWEDFR
jgi:hypothetical protein